MAPITRRGSAAATSPTKNGKDAKLSKSRKGRPLSLKSALRHRPLEKTSERAVTFEAAQNDNNVHVQFPTTPHPTSKQMQMSPIDESSPASPIDHSKRKEREELLKRAAKISKARFKGSNGHLLTPPKSPGKGRANPFDEPGKPVGKERTQAPPIVSDHPNVDDAVTVEPKVLHKTPKIARISPRDVDMVADDLADGLEMPKSIDDILNEPNAEIQMEAICSAFDFLKSKIQGYCRKYYNHNMRTDMPSFTYLKVKHPELFRYIQYVADGSQYGWEKLIKIGSVRENLVYAIISRAIFAHIFDAELFGALPKDNEALLNMCREYLNFDAFVRNAHRAEIILPILEAEVHVKQRARFFSPALELLCRRITSVLAPLSSSDRDFATSSRPARNALSKILLAAIKIHLAIRLGGANGTVYRFEHPPKLSPWDSTSMSCINQRKMDLTAHHGEAALVKTVCFPSIFATVPSGPNLERFLDPDFVEQWKQTHPAASDDDDDDGDNGEKHAHNPLITTFPIALSAVYLEHTPATATATAFPTLSQTMAREQRLLSDTALHALTGIHRGRNDRINKIARHAPGLIRRTAATLVAAATAWYCYTRRAEIGRLAGSATAAATALLRRTAAAAAGVGQTRGQMLENTAGGVVGATATVKSTMTLTREEAGGLGPGAGAGAGTFTTPIWGGPGVVQQGRGRGRG